ncbi:hypothetical protein WBP07_17385 [Novosphingobium sp. BL-8A]|uniref:hypothetical protein n=1 Tax=Novosphingobium sp. BL-8A TaxID=3127639 RepID=UPI003756B6CC
MSRRIRKNPQEMAFYAGLTIPTDKAEDAVRAVRGNTKTMKMEPIASQLATAPPRLSVVVPCYNEQAVLDMLETRLTAACAAEMGDDFEIVRRTAR